jgi:heat shock protein HslJ
MKPGSLLGLGVAALLVGCAAAGGAGSGAKLIGTNWQMVELGGVALPVGPRQRPPNIELQPNDQRAAGFTGCNRFFGNYRVEGDTLRFTALGSTKMACAQAAMELEKGFLGVLQETRTYHIDGNTLTLRDGERSLARFEAAPAD